jgi:hypothetical protein
MTVITHKYGPVLGGIRIIVDLLGNELAESCLSQPSTTGYGMPTDGHRAMLRYQARLTWGNYVGLMTPFLKHLITPF